MAMTPSTPFTIGSEASCSDGACGKVIRVVVDPIAKVVTHLVVEPKHRQGLGRLVPLELVEVTDGEVELRCTLAEFHNLDPAEETDYLPGTNSYGSYGDHESDQVLYHAYYGLGTEMSGLGNAPQPITYDTLPRGEVAVRRDERVHATDGEIGRVQGLVIDPRNQHVTHVLLQEGHLWGRKEVAIPINAVASVEDGIRLNIAKEDVENLQPVDIDHPNA